MTRTAPDRLLPRLEWQVLRRLDGRLQGGYRTAHRGSGLDFVGLRPYAYGDDARHIDWNVTARLDEVQVREFAEDRELTAWLVLDRSASMSVGGPGGHSGPAGGPTRDKHQVLTELAMLLARLLGRGGNRVGAVLFDGDATDNAVQVVRPGTGRAQALRIGRELERSGGSGRAGRFARSRRATTDLAAMLEAVAGLAGRRSLVLVISDFIGTGDWQRPMIRLAHRHEVVALRVVNGSANAGDDDDDPADALPEVGLIVVEDAETGEQLLVDSADPLFRARYADGIAGRDADLIDGMRHARVPMHRVGTGDDLAQTLVGIVAATGRRRGGGSPGGGPAVGGPAVGGPAAGGPSGSGPASRPPGVTRR